MIPGHGSRNRYSKYLVQLSKSAPPLGASRTAFPEYAASELLFSCHATTIPQTFATEVWIFFGCRLLHCTSVVWKEHTAVVSRIYRMRTRNDAHVSAAFHSATKKEIVLFLDVFWANSHRFCGGFSNPKESYSLRATCGAYALTNSLICRIRDEVERHRAGSFR